MDIEKKIELVKRQPTCEILTDGELRSLFEMDSHPKHYIGFEISGFVHLGTGLLNAAKISDFIAAGCKPTIFLADYHAWINGKLGGDLEKIQKVAKGYFKHAFISLGLDEDKVKYVLASELYSKNEDFWRDVLEIANRTTLKRMLRCTTIMGRTESEGIESSAIIYPAMQAADIFALEVQIMQGGIDQRKVHILGREIAEKLKRPKPVAVHTRLLMGLQGPQKMGGFDENRQADLEISSKMSKSKPETCIFVHDSEQEIKDKIAKAYCPARQAENNPVIELAEHLLMRGGKPLRIPRPAKFGGDAEFSAPGELRSAFAGGGLHPADLKGAVASELAHMLKPSRDYFEKNRELLDF